MSRKDPATCQQILPGFLLALRSSRTCGKTLTSSPPVNTAHLAWNAHLASRIGILLPFSASSFFGYALSLLSPMQWVFHLSTLLLISLRCSFTYVERW